MGLPQELAGFLRQRVYHHSQVERMSHKGARIVRALFEELNAAPQLLPERARRRLGGEARERIVGDYIAGMTDRHAQDEYLRLFHPGVPV